jgi:hypothetical protein
MQWPQAVTDLLDRITSTPSVEANSDEGRLNALSEARCPAPHGGALESGGARRSGWGDD